MIKNSLQIILLIFVLMNTSCQTDKNKELDLNYLPRYVSFASALKNPEKVFYLDLQQCPEGIDRFVNLEKLIIENCIISDEFNNSLNSINNLKELIIYKSKVNNIHFTDYQRDNLTFFKIVFAEINDTTQFINSIVSLRNLKTFSFAFSNLKSLPENIAKMESLEHLDIGDDVEKFDYEKSIYFISQSNSIKSLIINASNISTLPANISSINFLREFGLYGCYEIDYEEVINEVSTWKNLESLKLADIKMSSLPMKVIEIKNLKSINISENPTLDLPDALEKLSSVKNLEELNISYCLKTEGYDSLVLNNLPKLKGLKKLNMNGNVYFLADYYWGIISQLENLEEFSQVEGGAQLYPDIMKLKKLKKLDIQNTGSNMFDLIDQLPALETIDYSHSLAKVFPKAVLNTPSLVSVKLFDNEIKEVPAEISNLKNLEHLDLSHNPIYTLPESLKELSGTLKYLDLIETPLSKDAEKRKKVEEWLPNTMIFW